jgi:hypothetical protein
LAIPANLRCARLIAIALSLGELSTGVLLAAAIVAGDPRGGTMFYDVLDDAGRLEELKQICDTRHNFQGTSNSGLICRVNIYLSGLHMNRATLLEAGIA